MLFIIGAVSVVVSGAAAAAQQASDPEVTSITERLEALAASVQAPGDNGWPHLVRAAAIINEVEREWDDRDDLPEDWYGDLWLGRTAQRQPRDEEIRALHEVISELRERGALEALRSAVSSPHVIAPAPSSSEDAPARFSISGGLRLLAHANVDAMTLAWVDGRLSDAVQHAFLGLRLAQVISFQPTAAHRLLSIAVEENTLGTMRRMIAENGVSAEGARQIMAMLDETAPAPASHTFQGEHLYVRDMLDFLYSDERRNDGRTTQQVLTEMAIEIDAFGGLIGRLIGEEIDGEQFLPQGDEAEFATREEALLQADRIFEEIVKDSKRPRGERLLTDSAIDARILELGPRHFILLIMMPAMHRMLDSVDQMTMERDALRIVLALEIYRDAHGRYPDVLGALAPKILNPIPRDSRFGGSLRYRRLSEDEYGRDYTLYSVGADGEDNAGAIASPHPDIARDPVRGSGTDLVLNLPRSAYPSN